MTGHTLREFGTGDASRPSPDDAPAVTRLDAIRGLLALSKPCADCGLIEGDHRDGCVYEPVTLTKRVWRVVRRVLPVVLAGIIWTGPKLTPQEGADTMARLNSIANVAAWPAPSFGPYVVFVPDSGWFTPTRFVQHRPLNIPRRHK